MNSSDLLSIKTTISMTELKRNPKEIIRLAENLPAAILNRNKPEVYILPAKTYEALLDLIDDASLIKTIRHRKGGKTTKVKI